MSGWGQARGKINKLIFECETYKEAEIVEQNANNRTNMKHINICSTKPKYYNGKEGYFVQVKDKDIYPNWYTPNRSWS